MMDPSDNPLRAGCVVWRGFRWGFGVVSHVGEVKSVDDHLIVPVRYSSGQYGIVRITEVLKPNGMMVYQWHELRGKGDYDSIRYSSSMPGLITSSPFEYRVDVTEGDVDLVISILRKDCGLGSTGTARVTA